MISQKIKDLYLSAASGLTLMNLYCHKARQRVSRKRSPLLVNLGSGDKYIEGFVNIDANPLLRKDLWLDIRFGLPFAEESVRAIYLCHVLEHFDFPTAQRILRESFRVLVRGGGVRILVPSLEQAIEAFLRQDLDWFEPWPENYSSLGGRFNNFLLCKDQHRLMFDFSFASEALASAGFTSIERHSYRGSSVFSPSMLDRMEPETDRVYHERSLVIEALKPVSAGVHAAVSDCRNSSGDTA